MNRQTKRMMAKQGNDKPRAPERVARRSSRPASARRPRRSSPRSGASFARSPGPTRQEVINSTIVVLIAIVVMTALIFGFDYASAKAVLFLYG